MVGILVGDLGGHRAKVRVETDSLGRPALPLLDQTTLFVPHAACFRIEGEGVLNFSGLLDRFANVPDAAPVLHELRWQAGARAGCAAART
jgi:hypothetical protein